MELSIPTLEIETRYDPKTDKQLYEIDYDYQSKEYEFTDDLLVWLSRLHTHSPALVDPQIIRALAKRLKEISDRLGLGPLEP